METKKLYRDGTWEAIVSHPEFDLGNREFEALARFLPVVGRKVTDTVNILHLGIGNGREIPLFVENLQVGTYMINDIYAPLLEKVVEGARISHPAIQFEKSDSDIERNGAISKLRRRLAGQTLIALVGNAVIFSNRSLDENIEQAMEKEDLLLVTVETPHEKMFESYTIKPVYRLLAQSGFDANAGNTKVWYDDSDQCLKMSCRGQTLLASYKPRHDQLRQRLRKAGMNEILLYGYRDLHMTAGLFTKTQSL